MDTQIEQAGELANAALVAAQADKALGASHASSPQTLCLNCGAGLSGRYCSACGQPAHLHRSLLHLLEELAHSLLHFDTKGWRTLPLLALHPGQLTRRYIDGQRMRYISPLALFLFSSFVMFFVVTGLGHGAGRSAATNDAASQSELSAAREESRQAVASARSALENAQRAGRETEDESAELAAALMQQRATELADQQAHGGAQEWIATGYPWLDSQIRRARLNPDLFRYRLQSTASKYLFLLIPISLPFLWLMFAGHRGVNMYDHAIFSLYSLSFMALLLAVSTLLVRVGWDSAGVLALIAVPPLHMFAQLRGTYSIGVLPALWRTIALLAVAGTAFGVFLLIVVLVSLR